MPPPDQGPGPARLLASVIPGPEFGGAHNQAARLADGLAARGWRTLAVLPPEAVEAGRRLRDAGVEVATVPMRRFRADPRELPRTAVDVVPQTVRLGRLLRRRDAGLVQVHGVLNPQPAFAAALLGVPVVWQLLDTRAPQAARRLAAPLVGALAGAVLTTGPSVAREHLGPDALASRTWSFVPPVDADAFAPSPERRAAARRLLGVRDDRVLVGAVGNRNPQKGFEHLVAAFGATPALRRRADLRIVGPPSAAHPGYDDDLHARARTAGLDPDGTFRVLDRDTTVADVMCGLDVLVVSSPPRSEGIPTVAIEACAAGVCVVSTRVGGVGDVFDDGATALLVPALDDAALSRAIDRAVGDPALRRRIAGAGRERMLRDWTLDACVDAHALAYDHAAVAGAGDGSRVVAGR